MKEPVYRNGDYYVRLGDVRYYVCDVDGIAHGEDGLLAYVARLERPLDDKTHPLMIVDGETGSVTPAFGALPYPDADPED